MRSTLEILRDQRLRAQEQVYENELRARGLVGDTETVSVRIIIKKNALHPHLLEEAAHTLSQSSYSRLQAFLESHLQQRCLLKKAAAHLGVSASYLSGWFAATIGITFVQYVNLIRVRDAESLLIRCPDIPIAEVSEAAGFTSRNGFNIMFRRYTGSSPAEYRSRMALRRIPRR
ncbi:MAG TPA: helix-turn-helix domain-containing protein [Candidatus Paceibacterota bacterium]